MGAVAVSLALAGPARAGTSEIVVVVETAGGGTKVDAADDVRRAIADELGQPVLSPADPAAGEATRVLLVAIGPQGIAMSLRAGDPFEPRAEAVSRAVPSSPERSARLKRIAWLAGNMVRDQVAGIVSDVSPAPSSDPAPANSGPPTEPPPIAPTEPLHTSKPGLGDARASEEANVSRAASRPVAAPRSGWSVTAAGGIAGAVDFPSDLREFQFYRSVTASTWQVEVAHRTTPRSAIFVGVLEMGPDDSHTGPGHIAGAAAAVGWGWDRKRWYAEATAGIGIEAARTTVQSFSLTNSPTTGTSSMTTVTSSIEPRLYARGIAGIGIPLSPSLDAITRLTAHVSTLSPSDCYLALTIGVRLHLP